MSEQITIDAVARLAALQRADGPGIEQLLAGAEEIDWLLVEKALKVLTGTFGEAYQLIAERHASEEDSPYIAYAQSNLAKGGELEIDDTTVVSHGGDAGAYVHAWVWVSDDDAGIEHCSECGVILPEAGDGEDGLCAECADKRENETTSCRHCGIEVRQQKAINGEFCSPACADAHDEEE
ncbi:hypothetical protein WV31_10060 [Magnetospirillum sp. ME-1]|uniref:hypothetical protein n=1 Tax=Magnetospirillum sp. ME-1 TaxID=1639348 RepID=UPI000A17D20C|nr:hypothetical protein [Magnetospirillum sp. ME-1]ARJ65971.1 hypothetical protein WV31_10060 [Magnetospirillum sp. ME-1]